MENYFKQPEKQLLRVKLPTGGAAVLHNCITLDFGPLESYAVMQNRPQTVPRHPQTLDFVSGVRTLQHYLSCFFPPFFPPVFCNLVVAIFQFF